MAQSSNTIEVYLEVGKKRTFAAAIDWPGWCRSGRDEESSLQALVDTGPRYARVLQAAGIAFQAPADTSSFVVVERAEGNSTTDFGAPNVVFAGDAEPVDEATLERYQALLQAYWQALETAIEAASGKQLRTGPRGGGRDLDGVVQHVLAAEAGYLARLRWKAPPQGIDQRTMIDEIRQAELRALTAAARGELPERGPRGGVIWKPRTFVRRVGWHVLDHVWEIEDRII